MSADDPAPVWPELADDIAGSPVRLLPGTYHVLEVTGTELLPTDAFAVFRDGVEVTAIVTEDDLARVPHAGREGPFRALRFELARPFAAPGFLASVALAIAGRQVNQLLYSTWSFDYALVTASDLHEALGGLRSMGFTVVTDE